MKRLGYVMQWSGPIHEGGVMMMVTPREMRDRLGLSSAEWREAVRRERERLEAERQAG